ncbi:hypothetical protein H704_00868 [Bartonella bacilliformis Peru38]|uniref:Integral membrane protein n=2 Tax=Bartonella bacilliformis TaxID=774 RepID=A0ABP2SQB0_BARBA|nr:DUF475 domain-containing protein [Bartonella bacilliformis]ABM45445.1 putative membrane protein [Bartonella bacilliformis KC583]AMG86011.1 DUF475 domain-containing protein [Bartonella bacilliformis]EKS43501.1 hypothetical protein BbINS_04527 [Bartonella bacilliformis INS]EYS89672.1 hypothetical protein X472_00105 [Bartonella bacilliformis San Pedro600-02]EYS94672.1 hypothetical protein X470_00963 [Bartonella bacilliformis Peru-18]
MVLFRYFKWAFSFTIIGVCLGGVIGWFETNSIIGILKYFFICCTLGILEISLSFDNSIVNARILGRMNQLWSRRFLTWGIIIAVFGMRIIFPLLVVAFAAWISPIAAVKLAIWEPDQYATILTDSHAGIAAFGGTFLMMVGLKYFFDPEKKVHWLPFIEKPAQKLGFLVGIDIAIVLILILFFSGQVVTADKLTVLLAMLYGLLTFLVVGAVGAFLDSKEMTLTTTAKGGLGSFLYLEILDASFSFDGVVGAFAFSHNLFIIAIGLSIGAFYVRSMTVMLVETGTLLRYRYLEHGAFYAILILAVIMYMQIIMPVPEILTGFIGIFVIGMAFYSSLRFKHDFSSKHVVSK